MNTPNRSYRVKFPCRHSLWVSARSKKEAVDLAEMQLRERYVFVAKDNAEILDEKKVREHDGVFAFLGFLFGELKEQGYRIAQGLRLPAWRIRRRTVLPLRAR